MFNNLLYFIFLSVIAPSPLGYQERSHSGCYGEKSPSYQSLQNAWEACAASEGCKGVSEETTCNGNDFKLCMGYTIQQGSYNGCFYTKPGSF